MNGLRRKPLFALLIWLTVLAPAACGKSDSPNALSDSSGSGGATTEPVSVGDQDATTTEATPPGFGDVGGIVAVNCTNDGSAAWTLTVLDPESGEELADRSFGGGYAWPCFNPPNGVDLRMLFNADFSQVSGTDSDDRGATFVGMVDESGTFTKVPAGGQEDYASASELNDLKFQVDGSITYRDDAAPADAKSMYRSTDGGKTAVPYLDEYDAVLLKSGEAVDGVANALSPDGSTAFGTSAGNEFEWFRSAADGWHVAADQNCLPMAAIDADHVICRGIYDGQNLQLATITATGASFDELVPTTDRSIGSVVVSPDGKEFAYVATQGDVTELYRCTMAPSCSPSRVTELAAGQTLATWK